MTPTYRAYPERPDHEERKEREAKELRREVLNEIRLTLPRR